MSGCTCFRSVKIGLLRYALAAVLREGATGKLEQVVGLELAVASVRWPAVLALFALSQAIKGGVAELMMTLAAGRKLDLERAQSAASGSCPRWWAVGSHGRVWQALIAVVQDWPSAFLLWDSASSFLDSAPSTLCVRGTLKQYLQSLRHSMSSEGRGWAADRGTSRPNGQARHRDRNRKVRGRREKRGEKEKKKRKGKNAALSISHCLYCPA